MLKRLLSLGAAALAGLTAACEEGPATLAGTWRSPATWSTMIYATSTGPMLVEVHGTPFAVDAGEFRDQVAEAMSNKIIGRVTLFTARRDLAPRPRYRVVLAFNAPDDLDMDRLCTGDPPVAAEPRETVTVQAAFCDGDKLMASLRGRVARVEGPGDKRFRQLMAQVARELFGEPR